jgi:hypothetical protein
LSVATSDPSAAPDPRAALAALSAITADFKAELLLVSRRPGNPPELAATRPTERLADALRDIAIEYAEGWSKRELVEYGPATMAADGQVMWVPTDRVPLLAMAGLARGGADLPLFDAEAPYVKDLRLSALRAPTAIGTATFYRELRPRQVLSRSGKFAILRRGDRMDIVDEPAVLIDRGVDAIVLGGVAFFTSRGGFQRVFGFLEEIRAEAGATLEDVTSDLRIEGFEELRAAATSQPAMLGKMASIARKIRDYPTYRNAITMPRLVDFIRANPHTGIEIVGTGDAARLVFRPDPQHRFKILKLLDDDYLQSQLTHLEYESNSKGLPLV